MITLRNTQRSIRIDTKVLKKDAQKVLEILNYEDYDLGIWITNDRTIRRYNKAYRHKDVPTDILSFPFYKDLNPEKRIKAKSAEEKNIGDLIISAPYVAARLSEYGTSLSERLRVLLVHGICHLLGYDHETDADYRRMKAKENSILKKLCRVTK